MAQNNNFMAQFLGNDFAAMLGSSAAPQVDVKTIMDTHRKNTQAFSEAMKVAGEGMQAYTQRCAELMSQFVEDQSTLAKELMTEGSPEEKISKQADLIRKNYDKSIGNAKELADLISKSNQEASDLINKRISASINELKGALANSNKPATAAQKKAS